MGGQRAIRQYIEPSLIALWPLLPPEGSIARRFRLRPGGGGTPRVGSEPVAGRHEVLTPIPHDTRPQVPVGPVAPGARSRVGGAGLDPAAPGRLGGTCPPVLARPGTGLGAAVARMARRPVG